MKIIMKKLIYPFIAILLCACGSSKEESPAQDVYDQANEAFEKGDFSRSLQMLDSLQKTYPSEVELQRKGMALRPRVMEQLTLRQITTNDSLMAFDRAEAERLKPLLKWIKTPRMIEGYWVAAQGYNPDFMNGTAIQGRVSEIGEFYIVSSMKPAGNHTAIALAASGEEAATPSVPYDGESNYRIDGGEIITFSPAQSDTIGAFAATHRNQALTLSFRGKSAKSQKLTSAQVNALADLYSYSKAILQARQIDADRQRLEATLQVTRSQIARTTPETSEENDSK